MKQPIITRIANLSPGRVDNDLVRRVRAMKEAAWAEEVRIVRRAA